MADNPATAQQMAEQIESQADFGRELTALRERAGLRIRDVGRLSGIPVSTVGDYFSGRHLPADREQLIRILEVCGETDPARVEQWEAALARVRRLPGRRTGTPYRGLARFEAAGRALVLRPRGRHRTARFPRRRAVRLPLMLVGPSARASRRCCARACCRASASWPRSAPDIAGPVMVLDLTADPGRRPSAARRAGGRARAAPKAAPGGHRGPVRGGLHACGDEGERRGFIDRAVRAGRGPRWWCSRCARTSTSRRSATRGWPRALQDRQVVLGPMTRRAGAPRGRGARPAGQGGGRRRAWSRLLLRRPGAAGRRRRAADDGGARAGRAAAAVARACWPPGSTAAAARWRSPTTWPSGGIRDALTQTAERAYESLSPDAAAARPAAVPPPGARGRRPAAEPRRGRTRRAAAAREAADAEAGARHVRRRADDHRGRRHRPAHARRAAHRLAPAAVVDRGRRGGPAHPAADHRRARGPGRRPAGRSAALWRGSQLAVAREWAADADNRASLPPLAAEFVAASVADGRRPRARAQRRRTRRLQVHHRDADRACARGRRADGVRLQAAPGGSRRPRRGHRRAARTRTPARPRSRRSQLRAQDPSLAAQLSVAAYGVAHTPQATAALLESSGDAVGGPHRGLAGIVQSVSRQPGPAAARRGRRRRHAAAVERGRARPPVAGRQPLQPANGEGPAVHGRVQPGRQGRWPQPAPGTRRPAVGRVRPGAPGAVRPAADRADEHDLLGRVQPGRQDPRRRQRRRHGAAVERDRPGATPCRSASRSPGRPGTCESVAFSPGRRRRSPRPAPDKTVWLWDVANPAQPVPAATACR